MDGAGALMPAISPTELRHILDKLGITLTELARPLPRSPRQRPSLGQHGGAGRASCNSDPSTRAGKVSARTVEQASRPPKPR